MRRELRREIEDWLHRAERDLAAADLALSPPEPLGDMAVFHAQQAAEKALKAFLTARQQVFAKTHDLDRLVKQCATLDPDFAAIEQAASTLSPYAALFRYPGGPSEPTATEAQEAVRLAHAAMDFVRPRLGL